MTRIVKKSKKTKHNVLVVVRSEFIQHVVLAASEGEVHERIDRAYGGQATVYSIKRFGQVRDTGYEPVIWNE